MKRQTLWNEAAGDLWHRVLWGFHAPGAYTSSKHLLSTGDESEFYVDFDLLVRDPARADEVVRLFADKITEVRDIDPIHMLGFLEKVGNTVGALSMALALSIATELPHIVVRLGKQRMSERVKLKTGSGVEIGQRLHGRNVALVSDHATRGAELKLAVGSVEYFGGRVTRVFLFTVWPDKFESARREFQDREIIVHAMYAVPRDLEAMGIQPQKVAAASIR